MKDKKHIKSFNEATENLNISGVSESKKQNNDMEKLKAIKYLVKMAGDVYSEWFGAGMYDNIIYIIESDKDIFTKTELDNLIKKAKNK